MDKEVKKELYILMGILIVILGVCLFAAMYRQRYKFCYEESLSETVIKVDERAISLTELGYYIYTVEKFVDEQARLYDPEDPYRYWNVHFSAGPNSRFVSDMAEEKVYSACICDYIYEAMALEAGYALTEEEEKKAEEKADRLLGEMKPEQMEKTGLSFEKVCEIEKRKQLVSKYAKDYIVTIDLTGYSGKPDELISAGGAYYEAEILPKHTIWYNERIKDAIHIGTVTLDNP